MGAVGLGGLPISLSIIQNVVTTPRRTRVPASLSKPNKDLRRGPPAVVLALGGPRNLITRGLVLFYHTGIPQSDTLATGWTQDLEHGPGHNAGQKKAQR